MKRDVTNPAKLALDIGIRNFGPISSGSIKLKPLTVFIGPSNSGKSYAALLTHSILSALTIRDLNNNSDKYMDSEISKISYSRGKKSYKLPTKSFKRIVKKFLEKNIIEGIMTEIMKNFPTDLDNLKKIGTDSFELKIHSDTLQATIQYKNSRHKITSLAVPELEFEIKAGANKMVTGSDSNQTFTEFDIRKNKVTLWLQNKTSQLAQRPLADGIMYGLDSYFNKMPQFSFYFPATRSGILEARNTMSASIVKNAPYSRLNGAHMPKLSGVVTNFIGEILDLGKKKGHFYDDAVELEKNILQGSIRMDYQSPSPEIKYRYKKHDMSLQLASTAVSGLAPFVLYLKHMIHPGNVLVVEEPESHLHPKSQIIFAKFLVRLIRRGLNIVLTTHSVIFLEQMSHLVQAGNMPEKTRKKLGFGDYEYIKADEVSVYRFESSSNSKNTISEIEITEDGITQEDFIKIDHELYEEYLKLSQNGGN